jgi:rRNA-processing protein FCF1
MQDSRLHYVVDANVLIDLLYGELVKPFFRLPYHFSTPDIILYDEVREIDSDRLIDSGLTVITFTGAQVGEIERLNVEHRTISVADLFAYLAAREQSAILLTGDAALRQLAESEGISVHGILWVLDELIAHALIRPQIAADALQRILDSGSRLPMDECTYRLRTWLE